MARTDRFMIAPINSGVQTDLKPFIIPDDAFQTLNNAYVFRGRVRKRFGARVMNGSVDDDVAQLHTRLRVNIGVTNGSGAFGPFTVPGNTFVKGQMFSVGDAMLTVNALGTPAVLLSTTAATGTYNTTTGSVTIANATINTNVYFYPATSVTGFVTYETSQINDELTYAFDTQFAYEYILNEWVRLDDAGTSSPGASVWTSADYQFMWGKAWRGITNSESYLFVSNFKSADKIRYYNGINWNYLAPITSTYNRLLTARLLVPFKNRLLALNTVEAQYAGATVTSSAATTGNFTTPAIGGYTYTYGRYFVCGTNIYTITNVNPYVVITSNYLTGTNPAATASFDNTTGVLTVLGNNTNASLPVLYFDPSTGVESSYVNRCRFSQNGNPVDPAYNAWIETAAGLGGYIDAPTKEAIVTCEFLKDRLIVYFESSTWELVYTSNQILPFVWQQINTELGCESTFSVVPFDKVVLGVGNVGVHACNGSNVERIDQKIPDEVFKVANDNEGVFRVYGIRDYYTEMVYWTFPSVVEDSSYPNRVLVYNYKNGSWAFNDDSITAFGYYQQQDAPTWGSSEETWEESDSSWNEGVLQNKFRNVIAGNQQGFTFIVDPNDSSNCMALSISDVDLTITPGFMTITSINHNLQAISDFNAPVQGDYVLIDNMVGISNANGTVYPVVNVIDEDTFTVFNDDATGNYLGGGTIQRVSNINIVTKQYNFYVDQGRNALINKVDFLVDRTVNGQIVVDYQVSASSDLLLENFPPTNTILGTSILETSPYSSITLEATQDRLWHPVYLWAEGECIQLNMYMNDTQMRNLSIAHSDFVLNAMTFYTQMTSSRLQ